MRVLGFDAPGGRAGAWAVVGHRLGTNDLVLRGVGDLLLGERETEQDHYRKIDAALTWAGQAQAPTSGFWLDLIVIESAFVHTIAQYVGAAKMFAAQRRVPHLMLTSSSARKRVLGYGGRLKVEGQTPGKAAKAEVLAAMVARFGARRICNQHRADACLYSLAGHAWLAREGVRARESDTKSGRSGHGCVDFETDGKAHVGAEKTSRLCESRRDGEHDGV